MFADDLDAVALNQLSYSYMLRKKWEADLQAIATIKLLGEAMGNSGSKQQKHTSADAMLNEIGIEIT